MSKQKKRPTEASWESDEDLLGDTSSVSAFSSRMDGDEQIDEDALLQLDTDDKNQNYSFETNDIVERIDLGISSENCAFDDTANSQELDYEDVPEETHLLGTYQATETYQEVETEDPLLVGDQPNETVCTAQPTQVFQPAAISFPQDDEDSDDENTKKGRGRFQTERNTISMSTTHTKSTDIPDSLEITKEMQEEIDSFEKQKGRGKFNRQRLGQRRPGQQQQQQFRQPMSRGNPRQRGLAQGPRPLMGHNRFSGPRNANNMRARGPHNVGGPRGQNRGQFQQGFNPRPGMANGRPRFPHEIVQHGNQPGMTGHAPPMPQPLLSPQPQTPPMYQEQPQFLHPQTSQAHFIPPQNSQPQPLIPPNQAPGSTIHVNPNFQGPLPVDIGSPQHIPAHSVPQPLFSQPQPIQNFQANTPEWSQPSPHQSPVPVSYAPQPLVQQPIQPHPQHAQVMPVAQRPLPHGHMQNRPPHQGGPQFQPPQPIVQGPARQPFQQFQPRPQEAGMRPISHRLGPRARAPLVPPNMPQQVRQQRPGTNQNIRGSASANQVRGRLTQMRPRGSAPSNVRPRMSQMGQPNFQTPQVPVATQQVQGWNPNPTQLAPAVKPEEKIDPEKQMRMRQLEEQKKKRAERFKVNAPVKLNEGSPSNKKILIRKAEKRHSGDANREPEYISPIKTIKIEPFDAPEPMDHDQALRKALEDQKRHRELVQKAKEAKRQASANVRRQNLAVKLAQEGQTLEGEATGAINIDTANVNKNFSSQQHQGLQRQGQGNQLFQGPQQNIPVQQQQNYQQQNFQQQNYQQQNFQQPNYQQQNFQQQNYQQQNYQQQNYQQQNQQKQFNKNVPMRGTNRGQMSNRGQISNRGQNISRGQGAPKQGQPISVLGQSPPTPTSGQIGHANVRGQGHSRGRGRVLQKQSSFSQLQQVQILEDIDYESYDSQFSSEGPVNRTVLPVSSAPRQVVTMNSMGAASQGVQNRKVFEKKTTAPPTKVFEKKPTASPQRRIVVDSKHSSTVLIKDLPQRLDIGQISRRCLEYGKTKVFNYNAEDKTILVQFTRPAEAAAFLKKSFRFMVDMNYCTAISVPDNTARIV